MDQHESTSGPLTGSQVADQEAAAADGPTRWQQDARVGTLAALLMLGGGLLLLDGTLVGGWVVGDVTIGGWFGGVMVAALVVWHGVRRWRRRGALLPRDIRGHWLFGMAVLVGLLWLVAYWLAG